VKLIFTRQSDLIISPFFEVSFGNDRYDSRTMGAGEIAILYLWWAINRAPRNALILIEEPETYLSPSSQESLSHFLIAEAVQKKLTVVMTSHSAKIIGSFPDENLRFLFRDRNSIRVADGHSLTTLRENIGIRPNLLSSMSFGGPDTTSVRSKFAVAMLKSRLT
jgi:predicted ATPase